MWQIMKIYWNVYDSMYRCTTPRMITKTKNFCNFGKISRHSHRCWCTGIEDASVCQALCVSWPRTTCTNVMWNFVYLAISRLIHYRSSPLSWGCSAFVLCVLVALVAVERSQNASTDEGWKFMCRHSWGVHLLLQGRRQELTYVTHSRYLWPVFVGFVPWHFMNW